MIKKLPAFGPVVFLLIFVISGCATTRSIKTNETEKAALEAERQALQEELAEAKKTIQEKDRFIDEMDQRIAQLQRETEEQKAATAQEIAKISATNESLMKELRKEIEKGDIEIRQIRDRLTLTVAEQLFFDTGKADIKPEGQEVLKRIGAILKKIPEKNIRVEGHTDNVPIGPTLREKYPTNWELGSARAVNVVRFFQTESGIDPLRLSAVSYGQYRPRASNKTSSGKAQNRRIEIILIDRDMDLAKKMRENL